MSGCLLSKPISQSCSLSSLPYIIPAPLDTALAKSISERQSVSYFGLWSISLCSRAPSHTLLFRSYHNFSALPPSLLSGPRSRRWKGAPCFPRLAPSRGAFLLHRDQTKVSLLHRDQAKICFCQASPSPAHSHTLSQPQEKQPLLRGRHHLGKRGKGGSWWTARKESDGDHCTLLIKSNETSHILWPCEVYHRRFHIYFTSLNYKHWQRDLGGRMLNALPLVIN